MDLGTLAWLKKCLSPKIHALLFDGIVWTAVILVVHRMWTGGKSKKTLDTVMTATTDTDTVPDTQAEPKEKKRTGQDG